MAGTQARGNNRGYQFVQDYENQAIAKRITSNHLVTCKY